MTHDLFVSFAHAFGVKLKEVFIYKFEDGIFSCELTFTDGDRTVVIDARTSDGIAIAMRTGSPIYTTQEILDKTGFLLEVEGENAEAGDDDDDEDDDDDFGSYDDSDDDDALAPGMEQEEEEEESSYIREPKLENYAIEELERTIARLTEREEYEEAARVMAILRRKREQRDNDADPQTAD